jgi:DNA-binding CsgD family transcriptional regulator
MAIDIDELRRLAARGMTGPQIAKAMGVGTTVVWAAALCHGVLLKRGRRARGLLSEHDEEIAALYAAGMSMEKIGERFGWSYQAVRERLIALGIERRAALTKAPLAPSADAEMAAMREEGATLGEIAECFGVSIERARQRIARHRAK